MRGRSGIEMKVMAIDDSLVYLEFVRRYLLNIVKEEEILLCNNPLQFKQMMDQEEVDIVILDVAMPHVDGFTILKTIRDDPKNEHIPVIMLTSMTDNESFIKSFALGASDYIKKPIKEEEFIARVSVAIRLREKHLNVKKLLALTEEQNAELKEINAKLTEARVSLLQADKMVAVGHLAAGIAHEMNNPLGFVNSNFEMLKIYSSRIIEYLDYVENTLSDDKNANAETIKSIAGQLKEKHQKLKIPAIREDMEALLSQSLVGVKRLSDIVLSLRTFSHVDNENEMAFYQLKEIMDLVLLMSRNESKYVAELETQIPEHLMVYCNKGLLAQVFMNIVINATQAIKSQKRDNMGHIKISVETDEDFVSISIADDGPGIPKDHHDKIFNPFFTTKEVGQGTGLGLSISYDIVVAKHKGRLEFQSELGVGTDFFVRLPKIAQE